MGEIVKTSRFKSSDSLLLSSEMPYWQLGGMAVIIDRRSVLVFSGPFGGGKGTGARAELNDEVSLQVLGRALKHYWRPGTGKPGGGEETAQTAAALRNVGNG
jgi:hypothetical protein